MSMASLRLMQLCSANLPTGAYAFSQGLETATEEAWLRDKKQTYNWLKLQLRYNLGYTDLPLLNRVLSALQNKDYPAVVEWNRIALALRETNEFRLNDVATGQALMRVLASLKEQSESIDLFKKNNGKCDVYRKTRGLPRLCLDMA